MDIATAFKRLDHALVGAQLGRDPQFNLRIIGGENQVVVALGDESPADLAPLFAADRDILQVRPIGFHPPRGRHQLVVVRVDPPGLFVDRARQHIDIGGLELGMQTIIEDILRDLMTIGQTAQNLLAGLVLTGLRRFSGIGVQFHFLKENRSKLAARVEIKTLSRQLENALCGKLYRFLKLVRERVERFGFHANALVFHIDENGQ